MRPRTEPESPGPRVCRVCGIEKALDEFGAYPPHRLVGITHDKTCKTCRAAQQRVRAGAGTPGRQREAIRREARRRENMERIFAYLDKHPCVDCGDRDYRVLDFDHVRGEKAGNIANLAASHRWSVVRSEIEKCVVRCATCHRRRTAGQLGWYEYIGRNHRGDAAERLMSLSGQDTLLTTPPAGPANPPTLLGLAERLAVALHEEPLQFRLGQPVTIAVACRVELDAGGAAVLVAEEAAFIRDIQHERELAP